MKRFIICLALMTVFVMQFYHTDVEAFPINVSQGGTFLGTIDPFSGGITGAANYDYFSASGHPINGPTPVDREGQIFFYDGADGLNFNVIFNKDLTTSDGGFSWDINIAGSITDPVERLEDGSGTELNEPVNNNFQGRWIYTDNSDGGVIGEISGNSWTITIDPISYTNVNFLKIFDASGSFISLNLNTGLSGEIVLTTAAVPEPATIALLGIGLVGLGGKYVRKRSRKRKRTGNDK